MDCLRCGGTMGYYKQARSWICEDCDFEEFDDQENDYDPGECIHCGYQIRNGEWLINGLCETCDYEREIGMGY